MLVAMRVLQGAGGAMMVPVGRFLVLTSIEKSQLIRVMAFLAWPGLAAPVIAPLAGGLITTYANWHWLFLINAPLGPIAFFAAWRLIRTQPGPPPPRLDRLGVVLTGGGLAGLTYAAELRSTRPRHGCRRASCSPFGALLVASIRHLLRTPEPLINLRTLSVPHVRRLAGRQRRVLDRRRRGAVPAAAAVPDRVRLEPGQVRRARAVPVHRQHGDQVHDDVPAQPPRVPARRCCGATIGVFLTTVACGFLVAGPRSR